MLIKHGAEEKIISVIDLINEEEIKDSKKLVKKNKSDSNKLESRSDKDSTE